MKTGRTFSSSGDGLRYAGTHLLVDLFGARRLDDIEHIQSTLKRCVEVAGATLLHIHLHHFTPNGGVRASPFRRIADISIDSWPEADYAALDVFMCGEAQPQKCVEVPRQPSKPVTFVAKTYHRGSELEELKWQAARSKQAPVRLKGVKRPEARGLVKARRLAFPPFRSRFSLVLG